MNKIAIVLIAALLLTACTTDQVTTTLEATVDAAAAYDLATRPQDAPYIALVTQCVDSAQIALADGKAPSLQATEIGLACASAVAAGTGNVNFAAVAQSLSAFLRAIQTTSAQIQFSRPEMVNAFAGSKIEKLNRKKLQDIRAKIDKLKRDIGKKLGKHLDIETGQWLPGLLP